MGRNLPELLRAAERRVNAHVWPNRAETLGADSHLASIPANRDTDTDLLLIEAAERIEKLEGALRSLWPGLVLDLRYADVDDDKDAMRSRIDTICECFPDDRETKPVPQGGLDHE